MNKTSFRSGLLAGVFGIALAACATVSPPEPSPNLNASPDAMTSDTHVSRFNLATEVAALGRELQDPILLLSAARIIAADGLSLTDVESEPADITAAEAKPGESTGVTEKAEGESEGLLTGLLSDARRFARGDDALLAMVMEVEQSASRGSTTGAGGWTKRVPARGAINIYERFRGGDIAEVGLQGDGDTDVDLYIYDENGREICKSIRYDDTEYCEWYPAWTGQFRIKLVNRGSVYNDTVVVTN